MTKSTLYLAGLLAVAVIWNSDNYVFAYGINYGDCEQGDFDPNNNQENPTSTTQHHFFFHDMRDTVAFVFGNGSADIYYFYQLSELEDAADAWNGVDATDLLELTVSTGSGSTDSTDQVCSIVFGDSIENLGTSANTVGIAKRTLVARTGGQCNENDDDFSEIKDVDIYLNDDYEWTRDTHECGFDPDSTGSDEKDIRSVATHEMGHAIGIGHSYAAGCPTMHVGSCGSCESDFEGSPPGMRSLTSDDNSAYDFLYDTANSVKDDCGDGSSKRVVQMPAIRMLPPVAALVNAYPNPFNPNVVIDFDIGVRGYVSLYVHNIAGQRIAVLVEGERLPGFYRAYWDGRDGTGSPVASGTYLVRLQVGDLFREDRRITLIR